MKIVKNVTKNSPNTKRVFSSILLRKDKKDISRKVTDINNRLKIIASRNILILLITATLLEKQETLFRNRELHVNKRRNSILADKLIKYLWSTF